MNRITHKEIHRLLSLPLSKKVDQSTVERWAASFWDLAKRDSVVKDNPFVLMLPPPNITGNLHLGHALTSTVQDALIRQKRMDGRHSIWIPGFDHAGLATQSIVEKLLWSKQKITRHQLGREKFIELANEWKDQKMSEMKNQLDRLGLALDYNHEYFTLDRKSSIAVQSAFKQLFESGVIYRSTKSVYWSRQLETTLSDIEVERVDGVDRYTRTGEVVEKRPLPQWFVNTDDMALRSVDAVDNCSIQMIPQNYRNSWSSWLIKNGVQHWCISRQSWWGHQIPAFKLSSSEDIQENWVIADNLEEAKIKLGTTDNNVMRDPDVLDTWFSSSLLPLTISGWPNRDKFEASLRDGRFPLTIMETGFDILNFWVSKMVMMSIALEGRIPFKTILLHGMICDSQGKKMSKSKGNVIDPLDVIVGANLKDMQKRTRDLHDQGIVTKMELGSVLENQKKLFPNGIPACGADGLRAYLLSHDVQEEIVRVQVAQIDKIHRFSNKVWNIYRFVLILLNSTKNSNFDLDYDLDNLKHIEICELDQQVLEKLAECVKYARQSFSENYQLHVCFNHLELFWTEQLSTKYIESVRLAFISPAYDEKDRNLRLQLLIKFLVTSTKLLHPFMPHMTEFLYQKLAREINGCTTYMSKLEEFPRLGYEPFPKLDGEWDRYLNKS